MAEPPSHPSSSGSLLGKALDFRRLACDFSVQSEHGFPFTKSSSYSTSNAVSSEAEPYSDAGKRRLKIIDPQTGKEVVPVKVDNDNPPKCRLQINEHPRLVKDLVFESLREILCELDETNIDETYEKIQKIPWHVTPGGRKGLADLILDKVEQIPDLLYSCALIATDLRHAWRRAKESYGASFRNALLNRLQQRLMIVTAGMKKSRTGSVLLERNSPLSDAFSAYIEFLIELSKLKMVNNTVKPAFQRWVDDYTGGSHKL